jgi:uncharacterized protein YegL
MAGENIQKMQSGIETVVRQLRTDPHALESVWISVIAFAGVAKTIAPLVDIATFYPPSLPLGGGTSLGAALDVLMDEINRSVIKTTMERKGDWRPIVYLFTDGRPTDKPAAAIARWKTRYASKITLIAIGLGRSTDFSVLKQLTENTLVFEDTHEGDFKKFIDWISASVTTQSKAVGDSQETSAIPTIDQRIMDLVKDPKPVADDACVTLIGRCQGSHKPYIIKYERNTQEVATRDFKVDVSNYQLTGCFPLNEEYFAWSDNRALDLKVNTDDLIGVPSCPYCGNSTAFAVCACGKLLCINGPGVVTCPWCKKKCSFGNDGDGGFDVSRGRG